MFLICISEITQDADEEKLFSYLGLGLYDPVSQTGSPEDGKEEEKKRKKKKEEERRRRRRTTT